MSLKLLLKQSLAVVGCGDALRWYGAFRGKRLGGVSTTERAKRFSQIYEQGGWLVSPNGKAMSGKGSDLEATESIREGLPGLLHQLNIRSLLDIGCGDWTWMSEVELPCQYVGVDIVPDVIERNNLKFGSSSRTFMVHDAVAFPVPSCDAVLCREVIFHLCFEDIRSLLQNAARSGAKYILLTNDTENSVNVDTFTGDYRPLNLCRAPFGFPNPKWTILDNAVSNRREIGVWDSAVILASLRCRSRR